MTFTWNSYASRNPVTYVILPADDFTTERIAFTRGGYQVEMTAEEFLNICNQLGEKRRYGRG